MNKITAKSQGNSNKFELPENIFGALSAEAELYAFSANDPIIRFDQPIDKLWYIVKGKAKITMVHEDGKQSIVHFLHEGEYIGELTFLEVEKQHKNVIPLCETLCLGVSMERAKTVLRDDPEFLFHLNQYVGGKLIQRTWFAVKNQNYELKNRLAAYMLMSQSEGIYTQKHTETAEYLGVSYRHLLHTLSQFRDQGYVAKVRGGYRVDQHALEALAKDIQLV